MSKITIAKCDMCGIWNDTTEMTHVQKVVYGEDFDGLVCDNCLEGVGE